jgi:hypothetical protein
MTRTTTTKVCCTVTHKNLSSFLGTDWNGTHEQRAVNRKGGGFIPQLLCIALALTGCVPQMILKSQDRGKYSEYVQETNRLNTEREKSGLTPIHVMGFDEWRGESNTTAPAIHGAASNSPATNTR